MTSYLDQIERQGSANSGRSTTSDACRDAAVRERLKQVAPRCRAAFINQRIAE